MLQPSVQVDTPYLRPDSGSDLNIMPPVIYTKLTKLLGPLEEDSSDVHFTVAGGGLNYQADREITVDMLLDTGVASRGSLFRNISFIVPDQRYNSKEILYSESFLKLCGIPQLWDLVLQNTGGKEIRHGLEPKPIGEDLSGLDAPIFSQINSVSLGTPEALQAETLGTSEPFLTLDLDEGELFEESLVELSSTQGPTEQDIKELHEALDLIITRALANGLPLEHSARLRNIIFNNVDAFRLKFFKSDQALDVRPWLDVHHSLAKEKAETLVKSHRSRRYSMTQKRFMTEQCEILLAAGCLRRFEGFENENTIAAYAPAVCVLKPDGTFRLTWDQRDANQLVVPSFVPMESVSEQQMKLAGALMYFQADALSGFWQVPLDQKSQFNTILSTHDSLYISSRVIQGSTNGTHAFNLAVRNLLRPLLINNDLLQFVDDLLGPAKSFEELFRKMEELLKLCAEKRLFLSPKKFTAYATEVKFIGRQIGKHGVLLDDSKYNSGLQQLGIPRTAADLRCLIGILEWLGPSLPNLAEAKGPLQNLLTQALRSVPEKVKASTFACKGHTNATAKKIFLDWREEHTEAFEKCKELVRHQISRYPPAEDDELVLYTDASRLYWSAVLVAIDSEETKKPHINRHVRPVAWTSGSFTGSMLHWGIPEKEAYAVVAACKRLEPLLVRKLGFTVATDHKNLINIFDMSRRADTQHVLASKLQRWAMYLSRFPMILEHIEGDTNLAADYGSRVRLWEPNSTDGVTPKSTSLNRIIYQCNSVDFTVDDARVNAMNHEGFHFPSKEDIYTAQQSALSRIINNSNTSIVDVISREVDKLSVNGKLLLLDPVDNLYKTEETILDDVKSRIWIPCTDISLILRLCVVAHCGSAGHLGSNRTYEELTKRFVWRGMQDHPIVGIRPFCHRCLNCLPNRLGQGTVPRPYMPTHVATERNEILQFDFVTLLDPEVVAEKRKGNKARGKAPKTILVAAGPTVRQQESVDRPIPHALVMKDKFTRYCMIYPAEEQTADTAARGLLQWISIFGLPQFFWSDGGSHFNAAVLHELEQVLQIDHLYSIAYSPHTNGSVENMNRQLKAVLQPMISERGMSMEHAHLLFPVVQSVLNCAKSESLQGHSPMMLMMAQEPTHPLDHVVHKGTLIHVKCVSDLSRESSSESQRSVPTNNLKVHFNALLKALDELHTLVAASITAAAVKSRSKANLRRGAVPLNLQIGDFVMVHRPVPNTASKLFYRWVGPHRVTAIKSETLYEIEDILTKQLNTVHAQRLYFYEDGRLKLTSEIKRQVAHDTYGYVIDGIGGYRRTEDGNWELKLLWKGFEVDDANNYYIALDTAYSKYEAKTKTFLQDLLKSQDSQVAAQSMIDILGLTQQSKPETTGIFKSKVGRPKRSVLAVYDIDIDAII